MSSESQPTVAAGDLIKPTIVPRDKMMHLKWSQYGMEKTAKYYSGEFTNISKPGQYGLIFVQDEKIDEFRALYTPDGVMKVTSAFQYGQKDASGAERWIVYHNKNNKAWQHRFLKGFVSLLGNEAAGVLVKFGLVEKQDAQDLLNSLENYFGDYLHTFQDK